ncbi:MAG TPA: hypothetical protein VF029_02495 [Actinomycetota bacterium]
MPGVGRPGPAEVLAGPVAVCVDRPILSLDRPFTYDLPDGLGAGVGSLVQVPFHGKLVRGWVLGATDDVPPRLLEVRKLVSPARFFDPAMLEVLRWVSQRYVAPLAAVIARSHPPRVASEEELLDAGAIDPAPGSATPRAHGSDDRPSPGRDATAGDSVGGPGGVLGRYRNGAALLDAAREGAGSFVVRPAPGDEATLAVACVRTVVEGGRTAVVLVPELDPLPATARAVLDAVGELGVLFAGGDRRERYRAWLRIGAGSHAVVVGTRPAVFAPVQDLGLLLVSRESHASHREERAPYHHVRDVALERARAAGAICVLSAPFPSLEGTEGGHVRVEPARRAWPPVEVVRPGPEGRAPRLVAALRSARRAFLYSPLSGYGVARVCRACGEPAACAACGGMLHQREGEVRCAVCGQPGLCASCGARDFGIARGGAERVEEWARRIASVPVQRIGPDDPPRPLGEAEVLVGGVEAVKEFGPLGLDLVCILDADLAARRPGLAARERAVATWFEAAAWASPGGRVIVQTRHPNDPAVQALVTGRPDRFARAELPRRADAGFPVGFPVFRVHGDDELAAELRALPHRTLLVSGAGPQTICLVALNPGSVASFGRAVRELAERGVVTRVEAEPHL